MNNKLTEMIQENGVLVAAHRGLAGGNIPCNTMAAFNIALNSGAKILEMDLFKSTDGDLYVFHTGTEMQRFARKFDITQLNDQKVEELKLVNVDFNETRYSPMRFDDVLEELKGRDCLLNLDRSSEFIKDVAACVNRHQMSSQILFKTAPKIEYLKAMEAYAPDFMYMPIYMQEDTMSEQIEKMNINYVGAELVFWTEDKPVIQEAYLESMKKKGRVLWGNAILYSDKAQLSAGHSDDVSLLDDPKKGWGWLVEKGFRIIQTDWAAHCSQYLKAQGYSR